MGQSSDALSATGSVANTAQSVQVLSDRLDAVDALRAFAILWVVLFHYAVYWTPSGRGDPLLPYGDVLSHIPTANIGYLGVHLFFIISGFVISNSLTRCTGPGQFAYRRVVRLFPTLLFCGTITFVLTSFLGPDGLRRTLWEYLISLTFVPPNHVGRIIGVNGMEWLDGVYWSLWVEVRFYAIAAAIFFVTKRHFLKIWSAFAVVCTGVYLMGSFQGGVWDALAHILFAEFHAFFSIGIALAHIRWKQSVNLATLLLGASAAQAYLYVWLGSGAVYADWLGVTIVFGLAVPVMLFATGVSGSLLRWCVIIGQASYAYYLLHQNAGLALLTALFPGGGWLSVIGMIFVQLFLLTLSIVLTRYIETPLRRFLRGWALRRSTSVG